jgi:hypothetical protein
MKSWTYAKIYQISLGNEITAEGFYLITTYLATPYVAEVGWLVDNELARIRKEEIVVYLRHNSDTPLEGVRKTILEYIPIIATQRHGKHIPAGANSRDNRTSIARQRVSKHASLTIETAFICVLGQHRAVKNRDEFETPACRDLSLELNWVGSCRIMTRNELDCAKKTSYVIWSDRETVINPLPGCD